MKHETQLQSWKPERDRRETRRAAMRLAGRTALAGTAGLALAGTLAINEDLRAGTMIAPPAARWLAILFVLLLSAVIAVARLLRISSESVSRHRLRAALPYALLLACGVGFLFSGATRHPWSCFSNWMPDLGRGLANLGTGLVVFILLTTALTPFLFRRLNLKGGLLGALVIAQILCFAGFVRTTGGVALYRDDHPSFLFRLWELTRTFPQFLNYNPWWNGGTVNAYCLSSGTGALGLPLFPLWRFAPVHEVYTPALGVVYIVAMPLLAVASLRLMRAGWVAAACAGLLALGVSRHLFLWLLHYGTVCAPFVAFFVLPVAACLYRVLWLDRRETWLGVVLVLSVLMLLQWPPGALMALPIAVSGLLAYRRWSWRKISFLLICAGVVLLLGARQFLVILLRAGTVVSHVMGESAEPESVAAADTFVKGFNTLVAYLQEGHPLILFMGLCGVLVLPVRGVKRWFAPALLCFVVVTGWGPHIKPQLELGRMTIPMMFLAVGPAAVLCARLLRVTDWRLAPVRAALLVLLVLGAYNVATVYRNRTPAPYTVMPDAIPAFAERLRREVPEGGRVLFAGPTVHYFGRGHVAYLPCLAEREMMAVDYYHFPPSYVPYRYPPQAFAETPGGVMDFARLYNVTHVVTYHGKWKDFFRDPAIACEELEGFEEVDASVFRIGRVPSLFLQGSGRVDADFSRLDVQLEQPDEVAVLCYNWAEGLSAPAPVELFPYEAANGVRLIGIRPRGCRKFRIRFLSLL